MLKVEAIHVSLLPEYSNIDKGSGRCRVSSDLLPKLPNIRIGQVARFHFIRVNGEFDVLCSIWPDTHNQLRCDQVSIDDSVFVGAHSDWQIASGKIISITMPKVCSSVRYSLQSLPNGNERDLKVMPSNTLPVLTGFSMKYSNHSIEIRATNPPTTCVPNHMTIWIKEQPTQQNQNNVQPKQATAARTKVVSELIDKLVMPVLNSAPLATRYKGVMLLGPPGVGKSFAVQAVKQICAADLQIEIVNISIPELLAEDDPLTRLQQLLPLPSPPSSSSSKSSCNANTLLTLYLIDEIDALGSGHLPSETQVAIKTTLCQWLDNAQYTSSVLIATSNRAEDVDMLLRRGGRLEHEINVLVTTQDRYQLLACYLPAIAHFLATPTTAAEVECEYLLQELAERTGGYVAADIASLFAEVHRQLLDQQTSPSSLSPSSLLQLIYDSMRSIPPSCLRGVRISQPNLSLKDVVGCEDAKLRLQQALSFTDPRHAAKLKRFNIAHNLGGVLLYGPPGNSKTRLVAAVASEYHLPLIALAAADVYSAYVGDAEAEIRKAFTLARQAAPCVLFFDELDSLVTNRSHDHDSSGGQAVEARVLSTFLNEMDGVCGAASTMGVVVLAATNRLDCIDAALLRKGRFNQSVYVSLPNADERMQLLRYFCSQAAWTEGENTVQAAVDRLKDSLREGMSGADVEALCKEEALRQMEETLSAHLQQAVIE